MESNLDWHVRLLNGTVVDSRIAKAFVEMLATFASNHPQHLKSLFEFSSSGGTTLLPSRTRSLLHENGVTLSEEPTKLELEVARVALKPIENGFELIDPFDRNDPRTVLILERLQNVTNSNVNKFLGFRKNGPSLDRER